MVQSTSFSVKPALSGNDDEAQSTRTRQFKLLVGLGLCAVILLLLVGATFSVSPSEATEIIDASLKTNNLDAPVPQPEQPPASLAASRRSEQVQVMPSIVPGCVEGTRLESWYRLVRRNRRLVYVVAILLVVLVAVGVAVAVYLQQKRVSEEIAEQIRLEEELKRLEEEESRPVEEQHEPMSMFKVVAIVYGISLLITIGLVVDHLQHRIMTPYLIFEFAVTFLLLQSYMVLWLLILMALKRFAINRIKDINQIDSWAERLWLVFAYILHFILIISSIPALPFLIIDEFGLAYPSWSDFIQRIFFSPL